MRRSLIHMFLAMAILMPFAAHASKRVLIITNRGCEEICKAFQSALSRDGPVEFTLRDVGGDMGRLPPIVTEIRRERPDLVATWGTGITLGVVGKVGASDPSKHIVDIPVVYMYVGNPVESGVVLSAERSGRSNVAGANIAVPITAQIGLMQAYRSFDRVGMIYNTNEPAATAQAAAARKVFEAQGVAVTAITIEPGPMGDPDPARIVPALDTLARNRPGFLYYVGSTFMLKHVGVLSQGAVERGIPIFTAQEPSYRNGLIQLGLVSPLAGIGQSAAWQASQILFHGHSPGSLPTPTITRHSVMINMRSARALGVYPPMTLLQFAEITR